MEFKSMSYDNWKDLASEQLVSRFLDDEIRYSDGELTSEQYFYSNCKYWENELKLEFEK